MDIMSHGKYMQALVTLLRCYKTWTNFIKIYGGKKMEFKKVKTSIQEERKQEALAADLEKQKALTEYVAMMADVDLPTEEKETEDYGA